MRVTHYAVSLSAAVYERTLITAPCADEIDEFVKLFLVFTAPVSN